jgi:hypothetical protein
MPRKASLIGLRVSALIEDARVNLAPEVLLAQEGGDSHLSPLRRRRGVKRRARLHNRDL